MPSPTEITVPQLARLIGTASAPIVVDLRTDEDFALDPDFIPTAFRHPFDDIDSLLPRLQDSPVVVYCQKGRKISQGVVSLLRARGVPAETLQGGHFAWRDAGQMRIPAAAIPVTPAAGPSVWVTRHRPKIDRLACPWLIRRFVDPGAQFLFVAPGEVLAVAEKFAATPVRRGRRILEPSRRQLHFRYDDRRVSAAQRGAAAARYHRARRRYQSTRSRTAVRGTARRLARLVAHLSRRSSAIAGRDATLRRLLPLGARRQRGNARLAAAAKPGLSAMNAEANADSNRQPVAHARRDLPGLAEDRHTLLRRTGGKIALMHREIVDARRWLSEKQYLNALSFCMLLPGPEAMQLATYAGWRQHGTIGGIDCRTVIRVTGRHGPFSCWPWFMRFTAICRCWRRCFSASRRRVIIIVIEALLKVARRALLLPEHWLVAAFAFVAIFFFALPFPLIIGLAALFGFFPGDVR